MPPSERTLIPFPRAASVAPKRPRDPRIDAFRGLALAMIFIDHVPGNPYEILTIRNIGFSDAAEAFFVMSGIAAGLAYAGRFTAESRARAGLWPAVAPVWSRAWTLYMVQILLTTWAVAIFAAGALWLGLSDLLGTINLEQVFKNTVAALIGLPSLGHQLGYVNILPAFTVLLLTVPLAIMVGLRRPWLLVAGSGLLWLVAGIWRWNLPNFPNDGGWFFNPFAWQFLFAIGLAIGIRLRRDQRLVPRDPRLFALALGFLLLVFAWRYVPGVGEVLNHQMARLGAWGLPFNVVSHDKTFLAAPRLLHALALVYVLSCLDWVTLAAGHRWAAGLRLLGRNGLLVFSVGTLAALCLQVAMAHFDGQYWPAWLLPPLGLGLMLAAAWLAERASRPAPSRVVPPAPAASPDQQPSRRWVPVQGPVSGPVSGPVKGPARWHPGPAE